MNFHMLAGVNIIFASQLRIINQEDFIERSYKKVYIIIFMHYRFFFWFGHFEHAQKFSCIGMRTYMLFFCYMLK